LIPALEWLGRWMLEKYGLTVHMETRVDSVQITGDVAILLFQAVRELLFNVVKHANTNTARLKVARGDDQIQVSVEDEGIGFDVAQLGPHTGGLGLFSIRERFGYSGGSLEIDTAPGTGCRIELLMPLQASTAQKPGPGSSYDVDYPASAEPERVLTAATKIRVLLADDHDVERKGLARLIMEEPDMEVAGEASDGRAAVEMSRRLHPDVILMDVSMPAMTGVEATRVIHAESPDIRIIALSMYEEPERAAEMRKAGAVDYLAKSGPSEAVVAAIRAVARRPHA
jgi:CheY-like chemotaxis protein